MEIGQLLGSITIWTGTFVGVLKLADWLLSAKQKRTLASWATTAWIWLDDQRLGRFTAVVKSVRAQRVISVLAHAYMMYVLLTLVGKVFLGWNHYVAFRLGQPRIYPFQVWVEAAAMICSMILLTWTVHPRIATWIASVPTLSRYFARAAATLGAGLGAGFLLNLLVRFALPVVGEAATANQVEQAYGGAPNVILVHAATSLIGAPVLTEAFLLQAIFFYSIYWIVLIWILAACHLVLKFIVLRIAEHKEGPVLGLSLFLIALGSLTKAFIP